MGDPSEKDGDKKMKGKVQEVEPIPFDDDSLVLRLSSSPITTQNKHKRKKKIFHFLKLGNSSNGNEKTMKKEDNKREFVCKHCDRKFSSVKGLCGHQNVHKRRGRCEMDDGVRKIQLPQGSMAHGPPVLSPDQSFQPTQGFVRDGYGGNYHFITCLLDNHDLNVNNSGNGNGSNDTLHVSSMFQGMNVRIGPSTSSTF